jgi:hypothetical protein
MVESNAVSLWEVVVAALMLAPCPPLFPLLF